MFFLIAYVLLMSGITVVFKVAANRQLDGDPILFFAYATAAGVSLARMGNGVFSAGAAGALTLFPPSPRGSLALCLSLGPLMGWLYLATLALSQRSIRWNGAAVSSFFSRATFIGALAVSAVLWQEIPDRFQLLACLLILGALLLLAGDLTELEVRKPVLFLYSFLGNTVIMVGIKAFSKYGLPSFEPLFLTVIFSSALVFCVLRCRAWERAFWTGIAARPAVIVLGAAVGAANAASSSLLVLALQSLPASLVYPADAAAELVLSFLIARFVFREKGTLRETLALFIAAAGLVLSNL